MARCSGTVRFIGLFRPFYLRVFSGDRNDAHSKSHALLLDAYLEASNALGGSTKLRYLLKVNQELNRTSDIIIKFARHGCSVLGLRVLAFYYGGDIIVRTFPFR